MRDSRVDIVIPWVDGSDLDWLKERAQYSGEELRDEWYRDWSLLPYFFRGIENFAPWISKVHFVTCGHIPSWLNTSCVKLNVVNHKDYIPKEYLPTFNSNTIELNFHRIPDLADKFILFNDDMFLVSPVKESDFFKKGLPRHFGIHVPNRISKGDFFYYPFNNTAVINDYFPMRKSVLKNFSKWFNPKYGVNNLSTLLMMPFPAFYGFYESHLPIPYKKSDFKKVWNKEWETLDRECSNRFRTSTGVNHWLIENWATVEGEFYPQSIKGYGRAFYASDLTLNKIDQVASYIVKQKGKVICINDGNIADSEFDQVVSSLKEAFESILPKKSCFEL